MIDFVLDRKDPHAFEVIAQRLSPMLKKEVVPFTRDGMLSRIEDADSLLNLCLMKVHQAHQDFVYEDDLSDEQNERRFLAQVKTYIKHIMIDHQYSANLSIRKPLSAIVSTAILVNPDTCEYQPVDKRQETPYLMAVANETRERFMDELDEDECMIADLIIQNYTAEDVARTLGIKISRVRYLLYSRIQPCVEECCV